jgi:hypothetical protein
VVSSPEAQRPGDEETVAEHRGQSALRSFLGLVDRMADRYDISFSELLQTK